MKSKTKIETEEKPVLKAKIKRNSILVWRALKTYTLILFLILILSVVFLWPRIFINIYPGQGGVLWERFYGGTDTTKVYSEGLHIIFPWDRMYIYDLRIQQDSYCFDALSGNGLPIRFEISIRYRPHRDQLPQLHQQIGPNYLEKVVKPEVQAQVREVVSSYLPEEIYTSEGLLLQIIRQGALAELDQRNITLDDLLIKRMELPKAIRDAIEQKLTAEQLSLQYDFLLQKEVKEADRKRIEASGIRDFQTLVMEGGAFKSYLNFKGIQATLTLAQSTNSKIIILGNKGTNGLPLMFSMPMEDPVEKPVTPPMMGNEAIHQLPPLAEVMDFLSEPTRKMLESKKTQIEEAIDMAEGKLPNNTSLPGKHPE